MSEQIQHDLQEQPFQDPFEFHQPENINNELASGGVNISLPHFYMMLYVIYICFYIVFFYICFLSDIRYPI